MKVRLLACWPGGRRSESCGLWEADAKVLAENWSKAGATVTMDVNGTVIERWEGMTE